MLRPFSIALVVAIASAPTASASRPDLRTRVVQVAPAKSIAGKNGAPSAKKAHSPSRTGPKGKRKAKGKRKQPTFSGYQVAPSALRTEPLTPGSGTLHLFAVNFNEEITVELYDRAGRLRPEALEALNHFWRCRRTGTEKPINPRLFEILAMISDHFGGRRIELISGFRNQEHTTSFHFHGSASDIRIPGVSDRALQKYAESLDRGGMGIGIYPRGGFVHVDVRTNEPSYRWTDYSPPGSSEKAAQKRAKRRRSLNS